MPRSLTEWTNSWRSSGLKALRGWKGLGLILERGTCWEEPFLSSAGRLGIRASNPRPRAFLAMVHDLLGQIEVSLRAAGTNVVKDDGFPEGGRFGELDVPG